MSSHILKNVIINGNQFPNNAVNYSKLLINILSLPNNIEFTFCDLEKIEKIIRTKFSPVQRSKPNILLPLVAYVTEIGRRLLNGRWDMRIANDKKTWEPWIVDPNGRSYNFFSLVYDQFCELSDETASIVEALKSEILFINYDLKGKGMIGGMHKDNPERHL